jgi:spermidine synthase
MNARPADLRPETSPDRASGTPELSRLRPLIPFLFAVTGCAGLIYEVVWFKHLGTIFGVTTLATSTVLAVFMGGLAIGAAIAARVGDRWARPFMAYGAFEITLGLFAGFVPVLLPLANRAFLFFYDAINPSLLVLSLLRAAVSALVLLPPAALMGATLPVLCRAFARAGERAGSDVGFLYTINTLGAVAGAALGGFVLVPELGLAAASRIAVALNLCVGIPAFLLGRRLRVPIPDLAPTAPREWARPALLAVAALSGLTSLAYQVFWTRALLLSLGNTVYAFTVILVTVLIGITVGSAVATFVLARGWRPALVLAASQAGAALIIIGLTALFDDLPAQFLSLSARWGNSWRGFLAVTFTLSGLALFPATLLLGMGLPLTIGVAVRGRSDLARGVGSLYSVNTWAAIVGSLLAGFLLIPLLGIRDGILATAALNALAAAVALRLDGGLGRSRRLGGAILVAVLFLGAASLVPRWDRVALTSGVFTSGIARSSAHDRAEGRLVFYREGIAATVSVKRRGRDLKLQVDGRTEATSTGDLKTNTLLGGLPLILHPDPKDALVIGLGSGITLAATARHPLEAIDCVELSAGVVEAAKLFAEDNDRAYADPRVDLRAADGRNHLLLTRKSYDVIISQPSNMWAAGVGNLFTREFFELCRDHLREDGILCQWIQGYSVSKESLRSVLKTIADVFPTVDVWIAEWSDILLIASRRTEPYSLARIESCFADPRIGDGLRRAGIPDAATLLSHYMLDGAAVRLFASGAPTHTDDNRLVEFGEPRSLAEGRAAQQAGDLLAWQTDVRERLDSTTFAGMSRAQSDERLNGAIEARRHEVTARALESAGQGAAAVAEFRAALAANPRDTAIRRNLALLHVRMGVRFAELEDYAAAGLNFVEAIRADSTCAEGFANLGLVDWIAGRHEEAIRATETAAELDPENEDFPLQLGDIHRRARRWEQAAQAYRHALAIRDDFIPALVRLAECLVHMGDPAQARQLLERATALGASEAETAPVAAQLPSPP